MDGSDAVIIGVTFVLSFFLALIFALYYNPALATRMWESGVILLSAILSSYFTGVTVYTMMARMMKAREEE
jgi:hypothetical protein